MKGWLVDTNVLSELRRPRPGSKLVAFGQNKPLERLYVSVVTLAELRFGSSWSRMLVGARNSRSGLPVA